MQQSGKGVNISKQWADVSIVPNGKSRNSQLSSLRKKMKEHSESSAHIAAVKIATDGFTASDNPLKRKFSEGHSHLSENTSRCFLTAYKCAKNARSFRDYESDILLQELNGLDMGRVLHSNVTCANIISHIAKNMKQKLLKQCIESDSKFSVLLDESTSLSRKSCLIVYIRTFLPSHTEPVTFLLDLVELENTTASGIKTALLKSLKAAGFNEQYCQEHWLGIATDGCSTMLGKKNGLIAQLKVVYPHLIPWHCAAHRLELAVGDALSDVTGTNHFKIFMEKLYCVFSMSPKNQRELADVAESLNVQLLKIGKVFSIRWVASSYRTVKAIWQNYPALYTYFTNASTDSNRSKTEKVTFSSLAKHLGSKAFINNLALMYDALTELSGLSQDLQTNSINISKAHNKILLTRQLFLSLKTRKGKHEREVTTGELFKGVTIGSDGKHVQSINRGQFIQSIIDSIDERLFTSVANRSSNNKESKEFYSELVQNLNVLNKSNWTAEQIADPGFGDSAIERLCKIFRVKTDGMVRGFREFVFSGGNSAVLSEITDLLHTIDLIPVQTAECERGFSAMNRILTPQRASMSVKRLADCLFIYTAGPPLEMFKPDIYVKTWLGEGHYLSDDLQPMAKKSKFYGDHPLFAIWKHIL